MKAPVILIAGGYDKRLPFEEFAEVAAEKCRVVYLLGATTEQIEEAFNRLRLTRKASKNFPVIKRVSDLEELCMQLRVWRSRRCGSFITGLRQL